jgi:hypothetical protein
MRELIVATLNAYSDTLYDNVLEHNALLSRLKKNNNTTLLDGGDEIEEDLMYAENATFKWYSGYELLEVTANPVLTAAKFAWKQANANVVISGEEKRKNADSKTRKHNLLKARISVCEKTMQNKIGASLFSDGTGSGGKELTGLQALISDNPLTGIVGGIDRAVYAFWRNQIYSFNAEQGITPGTLPTGAEFIAGLDELVLRCTRGTDSPQMIVMDKVYFSIYKSYLQSIKRITVDTKADAGFRTLEYEGTPVFFDPHAPAQHAYALNLDYLFFKAHKDANFKLDTERLPYNQDAEVYPMLFMGNLTMGNANLQGVLKA